MRLYDEDAKLNADYPEPRPDWINRLVDCAINLRLTLRWVWGRWRSRIGL